MSRDLGGERRVNRGGPIQSSALERDTNVSDGFMELLVALRDVDEVYLGDLGNGNERRAGDMAIERGEEHTPLLLL